MVTTSPLDYDTRILNEADTLSQDYKLTILTKKHSLPIMLKKTPFKVKRVRYLKLWPYLLSIISSLVALTFAAFKENPDVYHAHDLDGLLCAYLPARLKKKILVYDSHELWSDLSSAKRMKIQWLVRLIEMILIGRVRKGITVCGSLAKILEEKYRKTFASIHNYPKLEAPGKSRCGLREEYPGMTIVLHIGSVASGRGVENLIEANKYLPMNFITIFLGNFNNVDRLINLIYEKKLENKIFFRPSVKREEILPIVHQADIGVVLTQNLSLSYYYSLPNKLFQYIAAEVPILASNLPEQSKIVLENQIGAVVNPDKPRQIAAKIIEMTKPENQQKYRANLQNLAKTKYNWTSEAKKLLKFYKELN